MDADEKELLDSVERGEWKSAKGGKRERARYSRYAKATFRKDRRLNIRLSSKDLEAIQKRALAGGLPYQTLIASLLHKYAAGRLKVTPGLTETRTGRLRRRRRRHPSNARSPRKSTAKAASEEDRSVVRQIANAREFKRTKGWTVCDEHVYVDDGVSGATWQFRAA